MNKGTSTTSDNFRRNALRLPLPERILIILLCVAFLFPPDIFAAFTLPAMPEKVTAEATVLRTKSEPPQTPGTPETPEETPENPDKDVYIDAELVVPRDSLPETAETLLGPDSVLNVVVDEKNPYGLDGKRPFNPSPERAVWLSALLPGLGQIYNRRYWKLPIIVGGFMGLGYATSWNNNQYQDYTQGYRDLLDSDPSTDSYMNFFPPNTQESDLDRDWLQRTMKSRKDYYRRNRDLCIIFMAALYLICMVDAYVDASLAHFDISPDLSMDVKPAMFVAPGDRRVAMGLNWALTF